MMFEVPFTNVFVIASLGALLLMVIKEVVRKDKRRLPYRIIAAFLITTGITGIILRPSYHSSLNESYAILLTDNYDLKTLDSLVAIHPNIDTIRFETFYASNYNEVWILGDGILPYEIAEFENVETHYLPSKSSQGIIVVESTKSPILNKKIKISGHCNCEPPFKIVLEGPQGRMDSAVNVTDFEFDWLPSIAGKQLYFLEYWRDSVLVERNPLPFDVQPATFMKVLLLNSFPTFESNHLKQFLANNGNEVVIRNRIATNRFSSEFLNTNRIDISNLSQTLLSDFDLIIADYRELKSLSRGTRTNLEKVVSEGTGLLVHGISDNAMTTSLMEDFEVIKSKPQTFKVPSYSDAEIEKSGFDFKNKMKIIPIFEIDNQMLSGYKLFGLGKIGVILSENTYKLNIKGNNFAYADYWTNHIDAVVAREEVLSDVSFQNQFPIVGEPIEIEVVELADATPKVKINDVTLNLKQDINVPEYWQGKYWASASGWQSLEVDGLLHNVYVYAKDDWQLLRANEKMTLSTNYFNAKPENKIEKFHTVPISLFYFFLLALIGAGYLWLEAKL